MKDDHLEHRQLIKPIMISIAKGYLQDLELVKSSMIKLTENLEEADAREWVFMDIIQNMCSVMSHLEKMSEERKDKLGNANTISPIGFGIHREHIERLGNMEKLPYFK